MIPTVGYEMFLEQLLAEAAEWEGGVDNAVIVIKRGDALYYRRMPVRDAMMTTVVGMLETAKHYLLVQQREGREWQSEDS